MEKQGSSNPALSLILIHSLLFCLLLRAPVTCLNFRQYHASSQIRLLPQHPLHLPLNYFRNLINQLLQLQLFPLIHSFHPQNFLQSLLFVSSHHQRLNLLSSLSYPQWILRFPPAASDSYPPQPLPHLQRSHPHRGS